MKCAQHAAHKKNVYFIQKWKFKSSQIQELMSIFETVPSNEEKLPREITM